MLKKRLAAVASALVLAGSVYAGQEQICPDIEHIKAEGLTMAELITKNVYYSYNMSTYNTNKMWGFVIAPVEADSIGSAVEAGNVILSTIHGPGLPQELDEHSTVECLYDTGVPYIVAVAVSTEQMISPSILKRYIQKVG